MLSQQTELKAFLANHISKRVSGHWRAVHFEIVFRAGSWAERIVFKALVASQA
jgi:hypothetical protein